MAVYPSGNPGTWPVDPTSEVGQFRALVGDLAGAEYDPVEPGYRTFEKFSDAEIAGFIGQGGSVSRGIAYSYLYLAGQAALQSKSVRDFDLQVDLTKRAADLRAMAQVWFDRADNEDTAAGGDEFFGLFPMTAGGEVIPEGTLPQWGRKYTWGGI